MHNWVWIVMVIYGIAMCFIFMYSLVQLSLLLNYRKSKRRITTIINAPFDPPKVLVQLPVFNEFYVVERLIDAVANFNYPKGKLEIQLLDDSTDESYELATHRVQFWKDNGVNINQIKRQSRKGFKAGALQYGLELSDAEFIAIFDADFIPDPEFLNRTIPHFSTNQIGMIQTRWEHLNRDYSLLTRVQAFALDAHFTIEQSGRNQGAHFINFNGTAGVWRRACIIDSGGWSADTLTEDLDLSYRAQLKGWKFKFLENVGAPAELPAEMNALKNQQYRWNKGAAECASKHLMRVLSAKKLPISTKIHALFHLLNSSVFVWVILCAILSLPLVFIKELYPELKSVFYLGSILLISFAVLAIFYYVSFREMEKQKSRTSFLWLYPTFLSLSMGMSLHNARAVILGYSGKKTPFIRTPKWNLIGRSGTFANKQYSSKSIPAITWFEGLLCLYFLGALIYEISIGAWEFVPLHLMLVFGFATVFVYSFKKGEI